VSELGVFINGELVGVVEQQRSGNLVLTYERAWQEKDDSYPVSLSMPLARQVHADSVVRPFMEGLLPDNNDVLESWARAFHVSARNPFALLAHMGEDCAGAVQFVPPGRYDELTTPGGGEIEWLTEEGVAERLRDLVERHGTGRLAGDPGQFSLAGAQPKTALMNDGERWGIPSGPTPTTHILKPPAQKDLDGFDINEHLCLRLAREIGLTVAESRLQTFAGQEALVVERYDRRRLNDGRVIRLHQEDVCQALAVSPLRKYESDGGPGPARIVELLLQESDDPETDVGAFLDALGLTWVIGGTDAHAKNYSLLLSSGSVRLAPLYDLISVLPYPNQVQYRQAKLAMRIDREYRLWKIRRRHWEGLAVRCSLDPEPLLQRIIELITAVPEAVDRAAAAIREEGIDHDVVDRVEAAVRDHSEHCLRVLEAGRDEARIQPLLSLIADRTRPR
jgi:serine/threonine-protein kinase HipA